MEELKKRILKDAEVGNGDIIRVDMFLNHCMDVELLDRVGKALAKRFKGDRITKVLTVESSGIAVACFTALYLGVPAIYAKKFQTGYIDPEVYTAEVHSFSMEKSYTIRVSKKYLEEDDVVLVVDDILSNGQSTLALLELVSTESLIDSVVSTGAVTTELILQYIRAMKNASASKVKTLHRIVDEKVEALEFSVTPDISFAGVPLRDLKLKRGLLLAGIVRQNGQIVIAPLGVVRVISVGVGQTSQMAHTPADPPAAALQIAVLAGGGPNHGGQTLGNGRFLSDHQLHGFSSSFPAAMRSAAGGRIPRRADRHGNFRSHNRGGREIKREDGKLPSRPPACASSWVHKGCR